MIYTEQLVVIANQALANLAILQSRPHEIWARFFSSSMKDDLRYTPSDCFATFPSRPTSRPMPRSRPPGKPITTTAPSS